MTLWLTHPFFLNAQNISEYSPSSDILSENMSNNHTCIELLREYTVFADLHIIQALKDVLEKNNTGALNQLEQANEWLFKAEQALLCS